MKKILFIGMSMNVGGAEKALVNLLNAVDYSKYQVDLLLFQNRGAFLGQIPAQVHRIEVPQVNVLFQSASATVRTTGLHFAKLLLLRYRATLSEKFQWKQFDQMRLHRWLDFYRDHLQSLPGEYDAAISYAGGETAYYMFDKVTAGRKVYFFHNNYANIDIDAELENQYVSQADLIVTISDICKESLLQLFPASADKICVLQNFSSPAMVCRKAQAYEPEEFSGCEKCLKLVSVGRLDPVKGYDLAVEAASILKKKGVAFRWLIIGKGKEKENLEKMRSQFGVEDCMILCGLKENPYPYMGRADAIVQTSRGEGKSVVLDEAKILGKPIIATNYDSVRDQVADGVNGLITALSPEGIAEGILRFMEDPERFRTDSGFSENDDSEAEHYMKVLCGE